MDKFIENLSSISWWMSVVIVGIIVNIIASYIKYLPDLLSNKISLLGQQFIKTRQHNIDEKVKELASDPKEETNLRLDILYFNLRAILFGVLAVITLLFISIIINSMTEARLIIIIFGSLGFASYILLLINMIKSMESQDLLRRIDNPRVKNISKNKK